MRPPNGQRAAATTGIRVRPSGPADADDVAAFLQSHNSRVVARHGELVDAALHPSLIAEAVGLEGVLTYIVSGDACEVLTLHVAHQWQGTGSALLQAIERLAADAGCRRLWLVTTNDNVDALRFYQRRGYRLAELRAGAVAESRRRLKPTIPAVGDHGIPINDELVLEKAI